MTAAIDAAHDQLRLQLFKKIQGVINGLGTLKKDKKNTYSNYAYISHEQLTVELRTLLPANHLLIIPEVSEFSEREIGKNTRTTVTMKFEIIDLTTGYSITKAFYGGDQDTMGKSSGQAITETIKRFQFKLFMVCSSEDPDPDRRSNPNNVNIDIKTHPASSALPAGSALPPMPKRH